MSDYTPTTTFSAKDSLASGNTAKIIRGSEFSVEFDNIETAVNSKADKSGANFTGTVTIPTLTVTTFNGTLSGGTY